MIIDTRELADELAELEEIDADADAARIAALRELRDEIGSEWDYGETLILEDEFEEYARELAVDIGAIHSAEQWPLNCIDWTRAARELAYDYSRVELDGATYLVRAS